MIKFENSALTEGQLSNIIMSASQGLSAHQIRKMLKDERIRSMIQTAYFFGCNRDSINKVLSTDTDTKENKMIM